MEFNGAFDEPDFGAYGPLYSTSSTYRYTYTYTDTSGQPQTILSSDGASTRPDIQLYHREAVTQSTTKLAAMKEAVNSFISTVGDSSDNHRISIVKFSGNINKEVGDNTYYEDGNTWNYTQVVKGLTYATGDTINELTSAVNGLSANGGTYSDNGLELAKDVLSDTTNQGDGRDAQKVVILFTDGDPGQSGFNGSDGYSTARDAIQNAKGLKGDGVSVYTVGVFQGADPNDTEGDFNKYMNAVSSNYPNATVTSCKDGRNGYITIDLGQKSEGDYYLTASSADGLTDVFQTIAGEVTSKVEADASSILTDTLSEYFQFPDNVTGENPADVSVQVSAASGNGDTPTWGDPRPASDVSVTVKGDTINITNFDYSSEDNLVRQDADGTWAGKKLIVTFPIELNPDAIWGPSGYYDTNEMNQEGTLSSAGLKVIGQDDEYTYVEGGQLTDSPNVYLEAQTFSYKVEHYIVGEDDPFDTETINNVTYGTEVTTVADSDQVPDGYVRSSVETLPVTITDNNTVIKVSYDLRSDPSLSVDKSIDTVNGRDYTGGRVSVGDTIGYSIVVKNTGNTTLTNVTVTDTLWTAGQTITVNGSTDSVNDDGSYVIGTLAPDASVTITYTYKVVRSDGGKTLSNTAVAEDGSGGTTGKDTEEVVVKRPSGGGDVEPPVLDTENHYGYIVGYDDGTVRPNGKITRAEVATIFFRLLTDESRDAYWCQTNDFSDVSASDWFNNAISTLTNAGILDGYEDGTFRPNGNITRAEFATIAVRFFDLTYEGEDLFPDISDHWARDYINQAAAAGFVNGYEDGTFRPNNAITRAEAVTLVNRTLERKPHKAHLLADMIQWPDNMDQTTWYYADIQEATNSHEYYMTTREQGEEYEIWTELLPMRDWPALEKEWSDANSSTGADVTR